MIDPEKILGSLLGETISTGFKAGKSIKKHAFGKSGVGGLLDANKAAIGMGLLGLAIGAYEHFSNKSGAPSAPGGSPGMGNAPSAPPPPPPAGSPPPPPSSPVAAYASEPAENASETAMLLIQGMIAAAYADYSLDQKEREAILKHIDNIDINAEERAFLLKELEHPLGLMELAGKVRDAETAGQVYGISLLVTQADTEVEKNYLRNLARRLNLSQDTLNKWHEMLDVPSFDMAC